jgi:predicted nucleic acid-binding protein
MEAKEKMIHLDANVLILAAQSDSQAQTLLRNWLRQGESFASSAIAWAEFLNGPLSPENREDGHFLIQGRIIGFGEPEAETAAILFHQAGRKRGTMLDCLIAATAVRAGAPLATLNRKDFAPFVPFGLRLASITVS